MHQLTPRQREIAALLAKGYTQRQVAHKLRISPQTVYNHTNNARRCTKANTMQITLAVIA